MGSHAPRRRAWRTTSLVHTNGDGAIKSSSNRPETLIRVTLNLTLAARWMIVQTSDFRLTTGRRPVSETAQKQVVLKYRHWTGLLCYTGIAQWYGHDTAQWLDHVLTHGPAEQREPREVLGALVKEGGWLPGVDENHRRHTFTLTLFANKLPGCAWSPTTSAPGRTIFPSRSITSSSPVTARVLRAYT
jgi:hypothetical protein